MNIEILKSLLDNPNICSLLGVVLGFCLSEISQLIRNKYKKLDIEVLNFKHFFTLPENGNYCEISKNELDSALKKDKNIEYIHDLNLYIYNKSNKPKIIKDISCKVYLKDKTIIEGNYLDLNTKESSNKYFDSFKAFESYYLSSLNYVRLNLRFQKDYEKKEYVEIKKIVITIIDEKHKKKKTKLKKDITFKEDIK